MRFLIDECVDPMITRWLREFRPDALSIYEEARGSDDDEVLQRANADDRILITGDKDFGEMIFREGKSHKGVILLRLGDMHTVDRIKVIGQLLDHYSDQLAGNFTVVTENAVRIVHLRDD